MPVVDFAGLDLTGLDLTSTSGDAASSGSFPPGTICNASGTPRTPPATLAHLIVIMLENENFGSVNGNANAPYITSLANACGFSTSYLDNCFADNLLSLPHYLALTSGSNCNTGLDGTGTGCITDDNDATTHTLTTTSIFSQVSSWKGYDESMPSNCDQSSSGEYAAKHNPPAYYTSLSTCSANDIPIAPLTCSSSTLNKPCTAPSGALVDDLANDTLPALSFVTPNLVNDMHDGTVTEGDNWLATYLPKVFASPAYLRGEVAVLLLWDEQTTTDFGGPIPNVFISPYVTKGTVSSTTMNHFAVLRAMEKALGISTFLGCASGTIPGGGACPTGSTADVRAALNF
jgi:phospholipase C